MKSCHTQAGAQAPLSGRALDEEAAPAHRGLIRHEELLEVLLYEQDTGLFRWQPGGGRWRPAGEVAGTVGKDGRVRVGFDGRQWLAHRLAWFWMMGSWPTKEVDHRDTNPSNNVWDNLRDVSHAKNLQNQRSAHLDSATGLLGAHPCRGKFRSSIFVDGKNKHLGVFDTAEAAHSAYVEAKRRLHNGCTL